MEMLRANIVDAVICVQRLSPVPYTTFWKGKNKLCWFLDIIDIGNERQRNTCDLLLICLRPWSLQWSKW
jgi:hypothetical protein